MKSQGTVYSLAERQGTWHIRRQTTGRRTHTVRLQYTKGGNFTPRAQIAWLEPLKRPSSRDNCKIIIT
jgi:hypothetical protein